MTCLFKMKFRSDSVNIMLFKAIVFKLAWLNDPNINERRSSVLIKLSTVLVNRALVDEIN